MTLKTVAKQLRRGVRIPQNTLERFQNVAEHQSCEIDGIPAIMMLSRHKRAWSLGILAIVKTEPFSDEIISNLKSAFEVPADHEFTQTDHPRLTADGWAKMPAIWINWTEDPLPVDRRNDWNME